MRLWGAESLFLEKDPRGPSLEELAPEAFEALKLDAALMRERLREEMQIEFTIENGAVYILDGVRVQRSSRAAVRIAVQLAKDGIIPKEEALVRIEPRALNELLHRQVDPDAPRDVVATGGCGKSGRSIGADRLYRRRGTGQRGTGRALCSCAARDQPGRYSRHACGARRSYRARRHHEPCGGDRARAWPTMCGRGVIAAVSDAQEIYHCAGWAVFHEGDVITIDGSEGQVLAGEPAMLEAALDDAFQALMTWADEARDIDVRANADTPADARTARNFNAGGIGLCRTEHMFFEADRLTVMREMIFADAPRIAAARLNSSCRCSAAISPIYFGLWRGCRFVSVCLIRRCMNFCQATGLGCAIWPRRLTCLCRM